MGKGPRDPTWWLLITTIIDHLDAAMQGRWHVVVVGVGGQYRHTADFADTQDFAGLQVFASVVHRGSESSELLKVSQ